MLMDKITEYAKKAGRTSVKPMLLMYYVLKSPDTPTSEKIMIYFGNSLCSVADRPDFSSSPAYHRMDRWKWFH